MPRPLSKPSGAGLFLARRTGDFQDEELGDLLHPIVDSRKLAPPRAGGFYVNQAAGGAGNHGCALWRIPPNTVITDIRLQPQGVNTGLQLLAYGYRRNGQAMGLLEANLDAVTALDGQGAVAGSRFAGDWDSSVLRSVTHQANNVNSAALPYATGQPLPPATSLPMSFLGSTAGGWSLPMPDLNCRFGADLIFYTYNDNTALAFSVSFSEQAEVGAQGQAAPTL